MEVLLSKFDLHEILDLHIVLKSGATLDFNYIGTEMTGILEPIDINQDLWELDFANLPGLVENDYIDKFTIRANEWRPAWPTPISEDFLITDLSFEAELVPEPSSFALVIAGGLCLVRRKRRS